MPTLRDALAKTHKDHYNNTSTIKAFLSDSLSMVLIATSLPFHLALQTTPKAPLPTTWKWTIIYEDTNL